MERVKFLDGLRGLAILLVVLFHAYARWPEIVPYADKFANVLLFKFGYLGVQLFFMISGFVILMSLEKSEDFSQFLFKRWLRLFPAMLIVTILVYFTAGFFQERPAGNPKLIDLIPGLTFIEPYWIYLNSNKPVNALEGAFWSLFVEFRFYVTFGILYFLWDKYKAITGLILIWLLSAITHRFFPSIGLNYTFDLWSVEHFSWFASGALAYLYFESKNKKYLLFSALLAVSNLYQFYLDETKSASIIAIILIFLLPIYFQGIRNIFANRFFLYFGLISYPFYLIHENMMVALIIKIGKLNLNIPDILIPLLPISFICILSMGILKTEPLIKNLILSLKASSSRLSFSLLKNG